MFSLRSQEATATRKIVKIEMPNKPDVELLIAIDRPGITYVNTACKRKKGIIKIIPSAGKEALPNPTQNQ